MIKPSSEIPIGALRLRVAGSWSVREFGALLSDLNDAYDRLASLMLIRECLVLETAENDRPGKPFVEVDDTWHDLYYGRHAEHGVGVRPLEDVLAAVKPFAFPLVVDALRLESPGWVQLLGSLNPLQVLADFISRWRAENTKRMGIERSTVVERERIRAGFVRDVLGLLPAHRRGAAADRLPEVVRYVLQPSAAALEATADDGRLLEAQVVEAGTELPPADSPRKRARGSEGGPTTG